MNWQAWMPVGAGLVRKAVEAGIANAAELIWQAAEEALGCPASWMTTAHEEDVVRARTLELLKERSNG